MPKIDGLSIKVRDMSSVDIEAVFSFYVEQILHTICASKDISYDLIADSLVAVSSKRRKATQGNKDDVLRDMFNAMFLPRSDVHEVLMRSRLERNLVLSTALELSNNSEPDLIPQVRHLHVLLEDLVSFRSAIAARFNLMAHKRSSTHAWMQGLNGIVIDKDDSTQNHQLAILRAIDRFDSTSGTLASYVANWMQNASNSGFKISLGESYSITRAARASIVKGASHLNNKAHSLDDAQHVSVDDSVDSLDEKLKTDVVAEAFGKFIQHHDRLEEWKFGAWLSGIPFELDQNQRLQLSKK